MKFISYAVFMEGLNNYMSVENEKIRYGSGIYI